MAPRCSLVFVLAVAVASSALGVELVRGGKPVARIVVAKDAPRAEQFAASELQSLVAKMSGARLPIASELSGDPAALVLIGQGAARLAGQRVLANSHLGELRADGYAVSTLENHRPPCLVLLGRMPRGTLYAVYDLLESAFGCGFFSDGDHLPRRRDIAAYGLNIVGNPAFELRACWAPSRFYAPKRFQATLWNAEDWRVFLRWMAKKRLNCVAIEFGGATRDWGEAFDKAFPETKPHKRETIAPPDMPPSPGPTAHMGWGLRPAYVTKLRKEALAYARETLGLETLYLLHLGQFELPLKLARPKLKWLPAGPECFIGTAGESVCLAHTDPSCRDLQSKLWTSIIDTYGTDHRYVVNCSSHRVAAGAPPQSNPVVVACKILRGADPKAKVLISAADHALWGSTQEEKANFLRQLPADTAVLYYQLGFPSDELYRATDAFGGRPFVYCSLWGTIGADLFQHCFVALRIQSYHFGQVPQPEAIGFFNWSEIRGTNPLMDTLSAEYAWTSRNTWRSEGASNNPATRLYLARRYSPSAVFPFAEAHKQVLRGAPRSDANVNYRAYVRWGDIAIEGTESARAGLALALSCKPMAHESPFYEPDLVDFGRNYLHQYIEVQYAAIVALVREGKRLALANAYSPDAKAKALAQLKTLEENVRRAHGTLIRLLATRKDMCLDDAILEAAATPGANKNLARAIREHQSGAFFGGTPLVDSIGYHRQLKRPQIDAFLQYARGEVAAPTGKPLPSWQEFFLRGTREFIQDAKPVAYEKKAEQKLPSEILEQFLKAVD